MPSRRICQHIHAQRRVKERYGYEVPKSQIEKILKAVQSNGSKFILRRNPTVTIRSIVWNDKELFFVYDSKHKSIRTFLTKEMVDKDIKRAERKKNRECDSQSKEIVITNVVHNFLGLDLETVYR